MDLLSISASPMRLLQVAILTTRELVAYAKDARNATRDKKLLVDEASLLSKLLERLQERAQENHDHKWLEQQADVVRQFKSAFDDLAKALKIDQQTLEIKDELRFKAILSSATWHFPKSEVYGLLQRVERLRQYSSSLMTDAQLSIISRMDQQQNEALEQKKMDEILNWLSPLDMNRTHQKDGDVNPLWCWGIPGAGKTVLASIVINHLYQTRDEGLKKEVGVGVVYLKYNEPEQTADNVLGSVLKQLVQDSSVINPAIQDLYEHHRQRNTSPSLESIAHLLQKTLEDYKDVFLIIDGPDECEEETRRDLIEQVGKLSGIHLMVTSRYLSSIEEELENFVRFEIKANKMDIELFIDYQIQRNRNLRRMVQGTPRLRQDIKSAVVKTAENMFLLARLHVESLASAAALTVKHVRQKLRELPTTLTDSYENAMQRIINQEEDHRRIALKTLAWVTHAFRPLSLRELQHALAVEPGDSELDDELLMDGQSITALCAGLVIIDKASDCVNLLHYSTKTYFESTREKYFSQYHASITLGLATYLTLGVLQNIPIHLIVRNYPLASYAAQYLGDHARNSPEESLPSTILEVICQLLTDPNKRKPLLTLLDGLDLIRSGYYTTQLSDDFDNTQINVSPSVDDAVKSHSTGEGSSEVDTLPTDLEQLSISASIISETTDSPFVLRASDTWQSKIRGSRIPEVTALHLAASMGLAKVASMLLKETPNIDAVDETGKTALTVAMERGFENAVEFLINGGALVDLHDEHGRMILLLIAEKGWKKAGDILVSKVRARLDGIGQNSDPQLRFILAVYEGDVEQITTLIEMGAISLEGTNASIGDFALFLAVEHGNGAMTDTLLHSGVNVNAKDSKGQTALFRATRRQDAVMMKLLLSENIDIESQDDEGRTAWSANVERRNKDILDILLRAGANPSTRGLQGVNPLYEAAGKGNAELVRFLLESGTNASVQTEYQWTPLHWAASYGHVECVRLLIDAGADVNVRSDQGTTPLDLAIKADQTVTANMLKQAGARQLDKTPDEASWTRIEPSLSTVVVLTPSPPLEWKLFLVFDKPLSRTLINKNNYGQFVYPRKQKDSPEPDGYIYQVSHVMETNAASISVRRPVRRAEMDEYPLSDADFNPDDVMYHIVRSRADYQEFKLYARTQTALTTQSNSSVRMHKDWTGNWKVHTTDSTNELLIRTTPDWSMQSNSQDYRWIAETGILLARSGWDDATPNICFEPALERGLLDLLVACWLAKLWAETALQGLVSMKGDEKVTCEEIVNVES